jgi:hypothetical protein
MSQPRTLRSINGANALVKKDGVLLGYATGLSINEVYLNQRIDALGEVDSRDIEVIGRVVQGNIGFIRMVNSLTGAGENTNGQELAGGAVAKGLTPATTIGQTNRELTKSVTDFFQRGFDLEIVDSADFEGEANSPRSRYLVVGCRPSSQNFSVTRGSLMGISVAFEALRIIETDAL